MNLSRVLENSVLDDVERYRNGEKQPKAPLSIIREMFSNHEKNNAQFPTKGIL